MTDNFLKMSQHPFFHRLAWPMATGIFLLGLSSCGDTQKEARSELTAKSFTFTVDEFIRAAREGNVTALRYFLEAGMAVDVTDAEGATALFRAAENGRAEAVAFLAGHGADTAVTGTRFDTPLIAAARSGSVESVQALLAAKADPAVRTNKNWTALTAAAYRGQVDLVRLLAPLGSESLDEALQIASLQGKPEVVDTLLASGADVFSRSKENKTPLMYAAAHGHRDVVRLLLLNGSNPLLLDNEKKTAADLAMAAAHPEVVALLNDPKLIAVQDKSGEPSAHGDAVEAAGAPIEGVPAAGAAENAVSSAVPGETTGAGSTSVAGAAGVVDQTAVGADALEVDVSGPAVPPFASEHEVEPSTGLATAAGAPGSTVAGSAGATSLVPTRRGREDTALASAPASASAETSVMAAAAAGPAHPRLQGARLAGMADGSTTTLKKSMRVRHFSEGQLPIVLEEVPEVGDSARIRVLGRGGNAPEIVPAGGAIGDTGLELVGVERKFMDSKMGNGALLDVSQAVVRDRVTGQRHIVRKNQAVHSTPATALISAGSDNEVYEVQEGDEFTAGDEAAARYKVLDVRPTQVVIENLDTRETATLARSYGQ
jgi:ankyrin repeat protein